MKRHFWDSYYDCPTALSVVLALVIMLIALPFMYPTLRDSFQQMSTREILVCIFFLLLFKLK